MNETTTEKENGRPAPDLGGAGPSTAREVSTDEHKMVFRGSPFARCGHIVLEKDALKISYDAFGTNHIVFILGKDLRTLTGDRYAPPAPVHEIRKKPDGSVTAQKIGYAYRSVSGQSLVISTTTSDGDLVIPWSKLQQVVNREIRSALVSRIRDKAIIPPRPPVPACDIRTGLARGF
jgi:hypothetical protein